MTTRIPKYTKDVGNGMTAFMPPMTTCTKCGQIYESAKHIESAYSKNCITECPTCQMWTFYPMYTKKDLAQMKDLDRFDRKLLDFEKNIRRKVGSDEMLNALIEYCLSKNNINDSLGFKGTEKLMEILMGIVENCETDKKEKIKQDCIGIDADYESLPDWIKGCKSWDIDRMVE